MMIKDAGESNVNWIERLHATVPDSSSQHTLLDVTEVYDSERQDGEL